MKDRYYILKTIRINEELNEYVENVIPNNFNESIRQVIYDHMKFNKGDNIFERFNILLEKKKLLDIELDEIDKSFVTQRIEGNLKERQEAEEKIKQIQNIKLSDFEKELKKVNEIDAKLDYLEQNYNEQYTEFINICLSTDYDIEKINEFLKDNFKINDNDFELLYSDILKIIKYKILNKSKDEIKELIKNRFGVKE